MRRQELKEIIKECIIELFQERFELVETTSLAKNRPQGVNQSALTERKSRAQSHTHQSQQSQIDQKKARLIPQIESVTSSLTKDPILAEIFKDTAMTTMQEQINADRHTLGKSATTLLDETAGEGVNIDDMLSEGNNNWAKLAFM
jgi:hypothetical protein